MQCHPFQKTSWEFCLNKFFFPKECGQQGQFSSLLLAFCSHCSCDFSFSDVSEVSYRGSNNAGSAFQVCDPTFPSLWAVWNSSLSFFGSLSRCVYIYIKKEGDKVVHCNEACLLFLKIKHYGLN